MKETIHIEYEWEPPRCSTCLLYGHFLDEYLKATNKHVVNVVRKDKDPILDATKEVSNDGFTTVK